MTHIDARNRHPDLAELRRLLDILTVLATVFGGFSLLMGVMSSDPGARLAGFFLLGAAVAFLLIRRFIGRMSLDMAVGAAVATVLTAGIALAVVEPIYSVFAIVPLLAVGVPRQRPARRGGRPPAGPDQRQPLRSPDRRRGPRGRCSVGAR